MQFTVWQVVIDTHSSKHPVQAGFCRWLTAELFYIILPNLVNHTDEVKAIGLESQNNTWQCADE